MPKKQSIVDIIKQKRLFFDGGTGTELQKRGLPAGVPPERWSLDHPSEVIALHREYLAAGADIIKTNTFGVSAEKYENYEEYIRAAVECASIAVGESEDKFIALDIGPSGRMLSPLGDLDFEDAVELFAKTVRASEGLGADLILIETMNDAYETKAAVLAAKENSDLPIFVTNVYGSDGKLLTGASPEAMVALLEGLGVSALGANCSLGPAELLPVLGRLASASSLPIILNPNAGLPSVSSGESIFNVSADKFAELMCKCAAAGAGLLGGCCGTTPEYIRKLKERVERIPFVYPEKKKKSLVSSYGTAVEIGKRPLLIGERINPTGKPKLREAIRSGNISYILSEAISEEEAGADILDVNVGLADIDEPAAMRWAVKEIQAVTPLPLQIDSGNKSALEAAMRIYNGKPLVNSVSGSEESMRAVFPLVKKYGGVTVALTMDERGIPEDAEGRVEIARRIIKTAAEYGIEKHELIFDPLTMAASADPMAPRVTLEAVERLHALGLYTSLGVSNVSFGLPERDKINSAFFAMALCAGLDAAIMNPHSRQMLDAFRSTLALLGRDEGFSSYIEYIDEMPKNDMQIPKNAEKANITLQKSVISGLKDSARELAEEALMQREPLAVINDEIIPALAFSGEEFEAGRIYLPSLLMSAEAAAEALSAVKKRLSRGESIHGRLILATVTGDIHDIGKNIVKLLLESHGFEVIDLGRDVPSERVLAAIEESGARLVGLSALMTTTVPSMERITRDIKAKFPEVSVMVGGAVLTEELAEKIGADRYVKDAMASVRYAAEVLS